ncbi:MAG: 5-formyltetrahydrofolate cyclo-ligase [Hyphomicrobiaceae bacterium]
MSEVDDKAAARTAAKVVRGEARIRHGDRADTALAAYGLDFLPAAVWASPPIVSGFLPIGDEIDPMPLMRRLAMQGRCLCLPVLQGKGKTLLFRAWRPGDPLAERLWGIREPLPEQPIRAPDILLVPLLAFDAQGYRLGYGGGYYDRTLRALRAQKRIVAVGVSFDEQRLFTVPHLDYDERLDWVLTPSGPAAVSGKQ